MTKRARRVHPCTCRARSSFGVAYGIGLAVVRVVPFVGTGASGRPEVVLNDPDCGNGFAGVVEVLIAGGGGGIDPMLLLP